MLLVQDGAATGYGSGQYRARKMVIGEKRVLKVFEDWGWDGRRKYGKKNKIGMVRMGSSEKLRKICSHWEFF